MKYLLIISLIFCTLISCKESPSVKFNREGVSIISPSGWKITDQENFDNKGYYLSIEKEGANASGILTLTWVNNEVELFTWLENIQEDFKNNASYVNSGLIFNPTIDANFNNNSTISSSYTLSLLGVKHQGVINLFYEKGKSFFVLKQEAIEDIDENKKGFETIEKSFSLSEF